jgi:hypothetical protein
VLGGWAMCERSIRCLPVPMTAILTYATHRERIGGEGDDWHLVSQAAARSAAGFKRAERRHTGTRETRGRVRAGR